MYEMHHPFTGFDKDADIRIWSSEDGRILGFVFFVPLDNPELCIRPELYGRGMEDEMLSWALGRAAQPRSSEAWGKEKTTNSIVVSCLDTDTAKAAFLKRHGFTENVESAEACVLLERSLAEPLPARRLPDGYTVVTMAERPDLACGVPDSDIDREQYRRVQSAPGYRSDLDVRAFHHDTELASGCTCWFDDVGNYGEFQPVSTKEEHRRKGLASAVMIRAMENLRRYGPDRVLVWTSKDLTRAVRLYQSLGFSITHEDRGWRRSV
jgi:GNAT superfamily N-acetyltransferase